MDIASLSLSDSLSLFLSMQSPINREMCKSHITKIVPFLCFHHFTVGHSLSLFCPLCNLLSIGKYADLVLQRQYHFCVLTVSQMDIVSLSLSLSCSLPSIQSPIIREICRSCIMDIVSFLCFHCFMDGHSLSLSLSLSMQTAIDREICRSCITEIVPFLCFDCFTDGHSLSLSLSLSCSLSPYNLLSLGKYADLV